MKTTEPQITTKEIFERIIVLETKLDGTVTEGNKVRRQFRHYVYILLAIQMLDILITVILNK